MYCFKVIDSYKSKAILTEGDLCDTAASPNSTFKIPLALMGYDANILKTMSKPLWPYDPKKHANRPVCQQALTPSTWLAHSCIWFSQQITEQLGAEKFAQYTADFNYGNKDVSGDAEKSNGLMQAWLDSSLQISPTQQLQFLSKLVHSELPVSQSAQSYTRSILYLDDSPAGYNVYAKTGTGADHSWFVGWYEHREVGTHIFVYYLARSDQQPKVTSAMAKQAVYGYLKAGRKKTANLNGSTPTT